MFYLNSDFGKISCSNGKLVYTDPQNTRNSILPHLTDGIVVIGQVNISGAAIRLMMAEGIPVYFLSRNGKYEGRLSFGESKNIFIRNKQHLLSQDNRWCLTVAKKVIEGKIHNQIKVLLKRNIPYRSAAISEMKILRDNTCEAETVDALRGLEGYASHLYFSEVKTLLPEWTSFDGRNRNPPIDPVNAVLSFLYTLLSYRIESAVISAGLDPAVSFFHSFCYSRNSLVYDLMEEFRAPVVDATTLSLFNLGILKSVDFQYNCVDEISESRNVYPVLLTKEGVSKVVTKFEEKLDDSICVDEKQLTYSQLIIRKVSNYKDCVMGKDDYDSWFFR